jgi:MFS family permease
MNISFLRAPDTHDAHAKRLAATFYAYTFFDEFILLYPFYALLFVDTGLSTAEISSLLVIWSVIAIVTEVPSGVWADVVSRRRLLALAPLLAAAGFALWVVAPSYWVFAAGFVLWGTSGALQSGATEALVYTELDRLGAAGRYAAITGRAHAIATAAVMASMAVAAPLFALGGYPLVGAASVLACVLATAVATTFPEHRERGGKGEESEEETSPGGYTAILRDGLREVRADRSIRRALLLVAVVTALWGALEEYVPLLAVGTGVAEHVVPLLVLLVSAGTAVGGVLAATGRRFTDRAFAGILGFGALALAAGAASGLAVGEHHGTGPRDRDLAGRAGCRRGRHPRLRRLCRGLDGDRARHDLRRLRGAVRRCRPRPVLRGVPLAEGGRPHRARRFADGGGPH